MVARVQLPMAPMQWHIIVVNYRADYLDARNPIIGVSLKRYNSVPSMRMNIDEPIFSPSTDNNHWKIAVIKSTIIAVLLKK